ncbi:hypothetical protein EVA_19164 [gut metagenome]|uniref:Uncharacterized protein n=1 Tax=gut metagenome TaxID=749906 RepID=J9FE84_9ZZZZ
MRAGGTPAGLRVHVFAVRVMEWAHLGPQIAAMTRCPEQ